MSGGFLNIGVHEIIGMTIPPFNKMAANLAKKISAMKEIDISADTSILENQIDFLVYHLYGLTYDEVLIVDPETPISREEYEAYNIEQ